MIPLAELFITPEEFAPLLYHPDKEIVTMKIGDGLEALTKADPYAVDLYRIRFRVDPNRWDCYLLQKLEYNSSAQYDFKPDTITDIGRIRQQHTSGFIRRGDI